VAYDQLGNQKDAQTAYERALTLKPDEPSVLNNYALSRMLAKDPEGARKLVARAESAGGVSDPMIARTIAMIKDMAPAASVAAASTPAPVARAPQQVAQPATQVAPLPPIASAPKPAPQPQAVAHNQAPGTPVAAGAPRPLMPVNNGVQPQAPRGVVMQAVPVDPLAGPVAKPHPAPAAKVEANSKTDTAPAAKPAAPATPVKVATKTDAAAKSKDAVPALRMSANAY